MAFSTPPVYHVARSQFYTPSPNEKGDTFVLKNGLEVSVKSGDITKVEAAAVVAGEDAGFSGHGAVAAKLMEAGGSEYRDNREMLKKLIREKGYTNDVYGCPAGSQLKCRQVFHALTTYKGGKDDISHWDSHMKNLFFQIGLRADNNRAETVATPLLGAGNAGGSMDTSLEAMVDGLSCITLENLRKVILVEYDVSKAADMKQKLRQILDRKRKAAEEEAERAERDKGSRIPGPGPFQASAAGSTGAEGPRGGLQGSHQTHGQEAWSRNEVSEDGRRHGASHYGSSQSGLPTSPGSGRSGHDRQPDSLSGAHVSHATGTHKEYLNCKFNTKIINTIANTAELIESETDFYSPGVEMETGHTDEGRRKNSSSSSNIRGGIPADEVTHHGGQHATDSEVTIPRRDFGTGGESERGGDGKSERGGDGESERGGDGESERGGDGESERGGGGGSRHGNNWKGADSSRNEKSSPRYPDDGSEREKEGGAGFDHGEERFGGKDNAANEDEDEDGHNIFAGSSPKDGQIGGRERGIGRTGSSNAKWGTPPNIVYSSLNEEEKSDDEDEDENEKKDKNDEDEEEDDDKIKTAASASTEFSPASPDEREERHSKDGLDNDYHEPTIHLPPARFSLNDKPAMMMWSSSQLSDDAKGDPDPAYNNPGIHGNDADDSKQLSNDLQPSRSSEESSRERFESSSRHQTGGTEDTRDDEDAFKGESRGKDSREAGEMKRVPGPESVGGGSSPEGKMNTDVKPQLQLQGFPDCGTILIEYSFPNGTQGPSHPAPGQPYKGTFRRAYLPDNQEGQRVLDLLQKAFDRKLTFQLVQSGPDQEWGVEFADIPHKTSLRGGPDGHGYPDAGYLARVLGKLEHLDLH